MSDEIYGYFSISRKLTESSLWLSEKFTKAQAWVDLISLARYEDSDSFFYVRGIKVTVKTGELAWSETELSKRWRWSRNKVRAFLATLEKNENIKQQKGNVITLISIVNYSYYQNKGQQTEQQKDNRKTTKGTHNNKDNKGNKGNNKEYPQNSETEFQDTSISFPDEIVKMVKGFHDYNLKLNFDIMKSVKLNLKGSCDTVDKLIRIDNYTLKEIRDALYYAVKDERFWKFQIQSLASLRGKGKNGLMKFQNLYADYQRSLITPKNGHEEKPQVYTLPVKKEYI